MGYREIDMNLTDEQRAMRDMVRKFGTEVVRPAGIKLDSLPNAADVVAEGSVLWDVFKTHRELGLHKMYIPKHLGGMAEDLDPMSTLLMSEELGYADVGLAISLNVASVTFALAGMFPEPAIEEMTRDFCNDKEGRMIGCWAITEPDHGSDWVLQSEDPRCGPSVKGVLKGNEYIVNGEKAAWVTNGTIATHAILHVGLDPSRGMKGHGLAFVPLDLPGISRGKPLDKIGQRPLNQGSIIFEDVRIPENLMIVKEPSLLEAMGEIIAATANGAMGLVFGGLAKAAFDEAYGYAKERIQGGVPIIEHQNIKLKLFKMFTMVEAARSLVRRMTFYNAANIPPSAPHAMACKTLCTETATEVASEAMQILGGNGLTKEYAVEKMFRDARAGMIEDGTNEALAIAAMEFFE